MPIADNHPLHEEPVGAVTATVASGQTATMRAPFTGRVMKVSACPATATTGGTATCTVTIAGTAAGRSRSIATVSDTGTAMFAPCNEGDLIVFAFTGSALAAARSVSPPMFGVAADPR